MPFVGTPGDDVFVLEETAFPSIVDGGAGIDLLVVRRTASTTPITLDLTRSDVQRIDGETAVVGFERVHFFGGSGDDQVAARRLDTTNYLEGNGGDDFLKGSQGADVIYGGTGNDTLYGYGGQDMLDGGDGNDLLKGNTGDDQLFGGRDNDVLYGFYDDDRLDGGDGNDQLHGEYGRDTLVGGRGNDGLYAGADDDDLSGGDGNDVLFGEAGDDAIEGGGGNDFLSGGDGNDRFTSWTSNGADFLHGGAGDDLLHLHRAADSVAYRVDLTDLSRLQTLADGTRIASIEQLRFSGGSGDDAATGGGLADSLYGGRGDDRLLGAGADDLLSGQDGDDVLLGGLGRDKLVGGAGDDALAGGEGDDVLQGDRGDDRFVFAANGGFDSVAGFSAAADDVVELRGLFADVADLFAHMRQVGSGVLIDFGDNGSASLMSTKLAELSASDFLLA